MPGPTDPNDPLYQQMVQEGFDPNSPTFASAYQSKSATAQIDAARRGVGRPSAGGAAPQGGRTPDVTAMGNPPITKAGGPPVIPGGTPNASGVATPQLNAGEEQRNQVVEDAFKQFGYTPSPEEIAALSTSYDPHLGVGFAQQVVGSYVNAVKAIQNANANDPTKQVLSDERGFFNDTQRKAAGFMSEAEETKAKLENVSSSAPKLFGGLTPDQIDAYLAPTLRSYQAGSATLESAAARRGLAGSSTEAEALADANSQFKENVLSQGLNVGLTEQQQQENILSGLYNTQVSTGTNFYGLLPGSLSRQGAITGAQAEAGRQDAQYVSQLPTYYDAYTRSVLTGGTKPSSPGSGGINPYQILQGAGSGALIGSQIGGPTGAVIGGVIGGGASLLQ